MLLTWLFRLSRENAISQINEFIQFYLYPNSTWGNYSNTMVDCRVKFEYFWQALKYVHSTADECKLFCETSTFPGTAPFMSREQRQRYLNQAFNVNTAMEPFFPNPHGTIDSYYICPECAGEELEKKHYFYLHRAHHLPGVTVCHKHGCALGKLTRKIHEINVETMPKYKPVEVREKDISLKFAEFSKAFMDKEFDCSFDELAKLIKSRTTERTADEMAGNGLNVLSDLDINYFLKYQIRSPYISQKTAMVVLMHLFSCVDAISDNLPDKNSRLFVEELIARGYTLQSAYREDIVKLRHEKCGTTFCTSPYGFLIGWECPVCAKELTLQEQYKKLLAGVGSGEYIAEDEFVSMDKPITVRHQCGKATKMKARSFFYEGTRCDCEWRVDFEKAKKEIEKHEGFSLIEYERTDRPVCIKHKCGGVFRIYYAKFLETPRCRVCERKGHLQVRTTEDLKSDIHDLTGNEYTLLTPYTGPREPIKIRHNKCGTTQEYLAHRFLDGARCRVCHIELTAGEFKDFVERYSLGRYTVTGRPTRNLYRVHDNVDNTDTDMTKSRVLQELKRPTPSSLLPLEQKDANAVMRPERKSETFFSYLNHRFPNGIVFTEDIEYSEASREEIQSMIYNFFKSGMLVHVATGVYYIGKQYDIEDVIVSRYLIRDGRHIGFLRGKSYAAAIGICAKPSEWSIATNKESTKTPNRKIKFAGKSIHIKGSEVEINDNNYLVLGAIDFLIQLRQYTDIPREEVIEAVRKYICAENNGNLPERELFELYTERYTGKNIKVMLERLIEEVYTGGQVCRL